MFKNRPAEQKHETGSLTTNDVSNLLESNLISHSDSPSDDINNIINNVTTNFSSDDNVAVGSMLAPIEIHKDLVDTHSAGKMQDLIDFLAKPYSVATGSFATTDTSSTFSAFDMFAPLITDTIYSNKLQGYFAIRADVVARLQINANRFQQGRYILAWLPTGGDPVATGSTLLDRYLFDLTTLTQLPHVEIDVSTQTEVIFKIPYISSTTAYPLNLTSSNNPGSPGQLILYPYSPLVSPSGSTTCGYEIFLSYHNVHLGAPIAPQMAGGFKIKKKKPTPQEGEQKMHNIGPIESFSKTIGSVANGISATIPSLSFITEPVGWAADIAAGVCSLFGWSNPLDMSNVTRAVQTWYPFSVNCDMPDSSMPLSLFGRNEVETLPGIGGTDVDEASWDYIKTIPAYVSQFTLTTSDTAGQNKLWQQCAPDIFNNVYTANSTNFQTAPPICYFANWFTNYRGGLRFNFKIVKTEFHSGRIAAVFQPYSYQTTATTSAISYANTVFAHREIIDIRDCNEFSIEVPYTAIQPYLTMFSGTATASAFGWLGIYVVNPITAPASVSSSVTVLVEVAGADDLEFAVPRPHLITPVYPTYHQSNISFKAQNKEHKIISKVIGSAGHINDNLVSARTCVGEKFTSLYQILKSSVYIPYSTAIGSASIITFDPFAVEAVQTSSSVFSGVTTFKGDHYANITRCFLFSRGGLRIRTALVGSAYPTQSTAIVRTLLNPVNAGTTSYTGPYSSNPSTIANGIQINQNLQFRGGVEVTCPSYGRSFVRNNLTNWYNTTNAYGVTYGSAGSGPYQLNIEFNGGTEANVNIMRQVSDDFQLGLFTCTPPHYIN